MPNDESTVKTSETPHSSQERAHATGRILPSGRTPSLAPELELLEGVLDGFWRPWMGVVGIVLVAAILALNLTSYWVPTKDGALYLNLARSLAAGRGYQIDGIQHTLVFPGFPTMLAAVFATLGENFFVMNLIEALMGIGCVLLSFALFRRWLGDHLALVIAILTGTTETLIRYSSRLLTDMPHLFFSLLSLFFIQQMWVQKTGTRRMVTSFLAGCSVMAACMMRPNGVVLIPVAVVALFWRRRNAMKLWEKSLSLLGWLVAIGGPLLLWQLYVSGVDVTQRRTYLGSSMLLRGFWQLLEHMLETLVHLPEQLTKCIARNHVGAVANTIILLVVVLGLVRLARHGGWHLTLYTVLGVGLLLTQQFQRRYLLAMLPFAVAGFILGSAYLISLAERKWAGSVRLRLWVSALMIMLMLSLPLANALPVAKLTYQKYRRPFYEKYDDGRWNDQVVLAEWMRNNTPEDTVFWTHYTSVLSYLSERTVRGPKTPYPRMTKATWRSPKGLLRNLSHWKPDYLIVDITSGRRKLVESLITEKRVEVKQVNVPGLKRLRIYRFKKPPEFKK